MSVPPFSSVIPTGGEAIAVAGGDVTLKPACYGIYVGGTGNLSVAFRDAPTTPVVFPAVPAGVIVPGRFVLMDDDLTTATNLVALYTTRSLQV
jgi:hypothetical protein